MWKNKVSIFQICQLFINLVFSPIKILPLATQTPISKMFGNNVCWISLCMRFCNGSKIILGSFFMAMYRIICMKRPAMKLVRKKQIANQLIVLEFVTSIFLFGFLVGGRTVINQDASSTWMSYCKGYSLEMAQIIQEASGLSSWQISVNNDFIVTFGLYARLFIFGEFIAYIILFQHLYRYNENLKKDTLLGISNNALNQRHKKNVITFFGQFVLFVTQIIMSVIPKLFGNSEAVLAFTFSKTALTIVFILVSSDLRQFCFRRRQ